MLERSKTVVTGRYRRRKGFGIVEPLQDMPYTLLVPPGCEDGAVDGSLVGVEVARPPREGHVDTLTVRVRKSLEYPDGIGHDLRYVSSKYGLAWRFPDEAEREALDAAGIDMEREADVRADLRDRILFTIDGIDARDFDDALGLEELGGDRVLLTVAIADVSRVVPEGGAVDREARRRGFSVYFPEACLHMLPEVLSTDVMSLRPGLDRLAVCVEIVCDGGGAVVSSRIFEAVIRSRARLTYEAVGPFLDGGAQGGDGFGQEISSRLVSLHRLCTRLYERRKKLGSLDFDLAGIEVIMGHGGVISSIGKTFANAAHRIVEEAMLLANRTVCSFLEERGYPVMFRVHEPPDRKDLDELADTLHEVGLDTSIVSRIARAAGSATDVRRVLQDVVDMTRGTVLESFVSAQVLRSLKRARYSATNIGHFGLAFDAYLHFTSPIRRYPDLMVHRTLKRALQHVPPRKWTKGLERIACDLSRLEEVTDNAMREVLKMKTASYMAERLGNEFDAVVTSVRPFGVFVEVLDPPVDGMLVDMNGTLAGFRRWKHRSRRGFTPGDPLRVSLVRADAASGRLDFAPVGPAARRTGGGGSPGASGKRPPGSRGVGGHGRRV